MTPDDEVHECIETGPFCRHWSAPSDCNEVCACGHACGAHDDYSRVGIQLRGEGRTGKWFVTREGRHISEHDTYKEACMFAEELYERIVRVQAS